MIFGLLKRREMLKISKVIVCREASFEFDKGNSKLLVEGKGAIIISGRYNRNIQSPSIRYIYQNVHQFGEQQFQEELRVRRLDIIEGSIDKPLVFGVWSSDTALYYVCDDRNRHKMSKNVLDIYRILRDNNSDYEISGDVINYLYNRE